MGKSFNDDVFNNDFNLDTINGLNISKEAIKENQATVKSKEQQDQEFKEDMQNRLLNYAKEKANEPKPTTEEEIKEKYEREKIPQIKEPIKDNIIYTKKTMIFKQEYLDIIDGLAELNDMQIKDVLNQLLEKSINMLDEKIKEKALKTGKKAKPVKQDKSIF